MKVRFWGVRGSTPTPTLDNYRYGGNTSCIEVRTPAGELLILDCGTGLRVLGKQLLAEFGHSSIQASIFLTHFHWDHIQGIPFFEPLYNPENSFDFHSFPSQSRRVEEALTEQMSNPYFPVDMSAMRARRKFHHLDKTEVALKDVVVKSVPLNHPQGCLGYRIECGGFVLVYATDNEPGSPEHDRNVRQLAEGADVFVYDAQYTPLEYVSLKKGWGHSTWREAVNIAQEAKVRQLILFHHDPDHNDTILDSILSETQKFFSNTVMAWEGMGIDFASGQHTRPRDPSERRSGTRQPMHVPMRVQGVRDDGTPFEEETVLENLSLGGAYFLLENAPAPEGPIEVEFLVSTEMLLGQALRTIRTQLVRSHSVKFHNQTKSGVAVMFR
jgi:phosphoribosyl 1,2-cyclic phosphodiesterase